MTFILHAIYIGPVIRMVRARQAFDLGLTIEDLECVCDACVTPDNKNEREAAKKVCQATCDEKCTISREQPKTKCPLRKFVDESAFDYKRRCKAAQQLKEAAKNRPDPEDFQAVDEEIEEVSDELTEQLDQGKDLIEDVSSPEDEW